MKKFLINLLIATVISTPFYYGLGKPFAFSNLDAMAFATPLFSALILGSLIMGLFYLTEVKPKIANVVQYIFALPALAYGLFSAYIAVRITLNGAAGATWGILIFIYFLTYTLYTLISFLLIWARVRWILGKGMFGFRPKQ